MWITKNPVLTSGEPAIEKGENGLPARIKIGDGLRDWIDLPYSFESGSIENIEEIINIYLSGPDALGYLKYTSDKPVAISVGGVPKGYVFEAAPVKEVFDKIFGLDSSLPLIDNISVTSDFNKFYIGTTYDIDEIKFEVVKGTNDIETIEVYLGSNLIHTTSLYTNGGNITIAGNWKLSHNDEITIKVYDDTGAMNSKTRKYVFEEYIAPPVTLYFWYGQVELDPVLNELDFEELTSVEAEKTEQHLSFTEKGFVVFITPKSFGQLSQILDGSLGADMTSTFSTPPVEIMIEDVAYYMYVTKASTNYSKFAGSYKFKF